MRNKRGCHREEDSLECELEAPLAPRGAGTDTAGPAEANEDDLPVKDDPREEESVFEEVDDEDVCAVPNLA